MIFLTHEVALVYFFCKVHIKDKCKIYCVSDSSLAIEKEPILCRVITTKAQRESVNEYLVTMDDKDGLIVTMPADDSQNGALLNSIKKETLLWLEKKKQFLMRLPLVFVIISTVETLLSMFIR